MYYNEITWPNMASRIFKNQIKIFITMIHRKQFFKSKYTEVCHLHDPTQHRIWYNMVMPWTRQFDFQLISTKNKTKQTWKLFVISYFWHTLEPRYNAPRNNVKSDTTLIFLRSQIIFKKSPGGSAGKKFIYFRPYHRILTKIFSFVEKKTDVGSAFIYQYRHILTKIFSLDVKTDVTSVKETSVSARLPKIHAVLR